MKKKAGQLWEKNMRIDFRKLTPGVAVKTEKQDPLYEKAFLSREDKNTNEYTRNTTTWD